MYKKMIIDPAEFLRLTSGGDPGYFLLTSGFFDQQKFDAAYGIPYLIVDKFGRVVNHDGRHRAASMINSGISAYSVTIELINCNMTSLPEKFFPQEFFTEG